ncbi:MAG: DUF3455 domain-containing protein [Caldilineaceae bacterium]
MATFQGHQHRLGQGGRWQLFRRPRLCGAGAIRLLVTVTGAQSGAEDGDKLASTTYIQRLNTAGGSAPATGCATATDIGNRAYVPYTADYYFYKQAN